MIKKYLFILLLFLFLAQNQLFSKDEVKKNIKTTKSTVIILNFKPQKNLEQYKHYSSIIPRTIATSLRSTNKYNIIEISHEVELFGDIKNDKEFKRYKQSLIDQFKRKYKADFIIIGSSEINDFIEEINKKPTENKEEIENKTESNQKSSEEIEDDQEEDEEEDYEEEYYEEDEEEDEENYEEDDDDDNDDSGNEDLEENADNETKNNENTKNNNKKNDQKPSNKADNNDISEHPASTTKILDENEIKDEISKKIDKQLSIKLLIIDTKNNNSIEVNEQSKEVGVILKVIIDRITISIDREISEYNIKQAKIYKPSKFLKFYNFIHRFTLGIDVGELFLIGEWADLYDNTEYIRPYLIFHAKDFPKAKSSIGISLNFDYFSTKNNNSTTTSIFTVWSGSLGFHYECKFVKYFHLNISVGTGFSVSRYILENPMSGPGVGYLNDETTLDPNFESTIAFNLYFSPIIIKFGSTYKGYFYADSPLHAIIAFGGIGFRW